MTPQTFLFFGRSGCGKGTQAKLLMDALKKKTPEQKVSYIETGQKLREFAEEAGMTAETTSKIMSEGGLLPSFLPIWIWTNYLVRHYTGNEHFILDGLARREYEAPILDDALRFYKRESPIVIYITVSREWSKERMKARGRGDDTEKDMDARLDWFETNVMPTIDYFRKNLYYRFVEVSGERPIEVIHKEILEKAGLDF